jgi:cytochrome c6
MWNKIIMVMVATSLLSFTTNYQKTHVSEIGKSIYLTNCARCHGVDGTKGKWGAKNLRQSVLPDSALTNVISRGKGLMPSWKNRLADKEIDAVKEYVKILRRSV